ILPSILLSSCYPNCTTKSISPSPLSNIITTPFAQTKKKSCGLYHRILLLPNAILTSQTNQPLPAQPLQSHLIPVISIVQATLNPGDRSCTCPGLGLNLVVRAALAKHPSYLQPLRHGFNLIHRTQVIEEDIA